MKSRAIRVSEQSYTLLEPNLHDGWLVGISIPKKGMVELTVTETNGKRYNIVLDDVYEFNANEFREGNIILDVTIAQGNSVKLADVAPLRFAGGPRELSDKHAEVTHKKIVNDSLFVIEVTSSYGCHLVGVAKSISLFESD